MQGLSCRRGSQLLASVYPLLTSQVQPEPQWPCHRLMVLIGGEKSN
jgi:hypothetical protein